MASSGVAVFRGGATIVIHDKNADRAGPATSMARCLYLTDQRTDVLVLPLTHFSERIPEFGFQPHACAAAFGDDISIYETTGRHGYLLQAGGKRNMSGLTRRSQRPDITFFLTVPID